MVGVHVHFASSESPTTAPLLGVDIARSSEQLEFNLGMTPAHRLARARRWSGVGWARGQRGVTVAEPALFTPPGTGLLQANRVYEAVLILPEWPEAVVQPKASNLSAAVKRRGRAETDRATTMPDAVVVAQSSPAVPAEQPCLHLMVATEREGFIESEVGLRFNGALPPTSHVPRALGSIITHTLSLSPSTAMQGCVFVR